ncbi:MAG: DUF126 domain-containing protein [Pseudomonadales bacterium]
MRHNIPFKRLLPGNATGKALLLDEPISFWGGINPANGEIIDVHHPQCGQNISNTILVLPGTRGSTAAPGALLEAIYSRHGPRAIVLPYADPAVIIAIKVAVEMGLQSIPVICISKQDFTYCQTGRQLEIHLSTFSADIS